MNIVYVSIFVWTKKEYSQRLPAGDQLIPYLPGVNWECYLKIILKICVSHCQWGFCYDGA